MLRIGVKVVLLCLLVLTCKKKPAEIIPQKLNIPKEGKVSDSFAVDLIQGYYATVSYTDALIGKILEELTSMLYDHKIDKNENVNVVGLQKYIDVVIILKNVLHTKYKVTIL